MSPDEGEVSGPGVALVAGGCIDSGDGDGAGVADGVCGSVLTPGGACGAGRPVPGVAVGSVGKGRACGGTDCRCSVPGGRVASCCAGLGVVCVCAWAATQRIKDNPTV